MKTFEQIYCAEHRCGPDAFSRRVFWSCLPWPAIPFVPLVGGMESDYFDADRELIRGVGAAATMAQVKEEIRDYFMDSQNRGWLRRAWNVRVSTNRLRRLARLYLPDPSPAPPEGVPPTAENELRGSKESGS